MHKICCLFSLVRLLLKWKTPLNIVHTERGEILCGRQFVGGIGDSHQTQKIALQQVVLCLGATCLAALFGIQQQPSSLASSLSMGPQHLFPLLCRNFLYLARSWTLSIGAQVSVSNSLREMNSIFSSVIFHFLLLLLSCSKDNIRKHDSTWEDHETFLTRASKCHVVPRMLLTRRTASECKLSPFRSTREIKKEQS